MNINDFIEFNPATGTRGDIPKAPGNYLVTIRDIKALPTMGYEVVTQQYQGQELIYTGISKTDLYKRIWKSHVYGTAGRSTLRRTLGTLFGYAPIPRDKNNPTNGKIRFNEEDEAALTTWIKENLVFYIKLDDNPGELETELIRTLNPPLNLDENDNPVNQEFRAALSTCRSRKPSIK